MLELMMSLVVGMIGLAAGFAYARAQIRSFAGQDEIARMQSSAEVVLEGLERDLRNAAYGTSFYAGMEKGSGFAGKTAVLDSGGASRGFPALRIANNVVAPGVMAGSDALLLLRITSAAAITNQQIPCNPGSGTNIDLVQNTKAALDVCLTSGDALVLVSDSTRPTGEPTSMLLVVDGPASGVDQLRLVGGWGMSPGAITRCTNGSNPPNGVGVYSTVVCVQPSSYWVDATARLRLWEPPSGAAAATATMLNGRVPINPVTDRVLAEGVEDLQFAFRFSGDTTLPAGMRNEWILAGGVADSSFSDEGMLSEARVVRVSAIVRSTRAFEERNVGREGLAGTKLEDHPLGAVYDRRFVRKLVRFQAELRNLRIFDTLASATRGWNDLRSY